MAVLIEASLQHGLFCCCVDFSSTRVAVALAHNEFTFAVRVGMTCRLTFAVGRYGRVLPGGSWALNALTGRRADPLKSIIPCTLRPLGRDRVLR